MHFRAHVGNNIWHQSKVQEILRGLVNFRCSAPWGIFYSCFIIPQTKSEVRSMKMSVTGKYIRAVKWESVYVHVCRQSMPRICRLTYIAMYQWYEEEEPYICVCVHIQCIRVTGRVHAIRVLPPHAPPSHIALRQSNLVLFPCFSLSVLRVKTLDTATIRFVPGSPTMRC